MRQGLLVIGLVVVGLVGCENASEPVSQPQERTERNDKQSGSPAVALWSPEFKSQTVKECIQSATADGNSSGVKKCRCVIDKASTTIPEQKFKTIGTDPEVKALIKQIGALC